MICEFCGKDESQGLHRGQLNGAGEEILQCVPVLERSCFLCGDVGHTAVQSLTWTCTRCRLVVYGMGCVLLAVSLQGCVLITTPIEVAGDVAKSAIDAISPFDDGPPEDEENEENTHEKE